MVVERHLTSRFFCGFAWAVACAVAATTMSPDVAQGQSAEKAPLFEQDVLPILKAHCLKCHDRQEPEGGLNLSSAAGLSKGSDTGPVVIQGSAEKSVLFQKITKGTMPPPKEKDPLGEEQIAIVRKWIDGGAAIDRPDEPLTDSSEPKVSEEDRRFWAFRKPVSPPVPQSKHAELPRTPIDAFVLAKLEAQGLTFSPEASKSTLLRRAYLDLIGLPPSAEEIQAFIGDSRPDAYERLIDRLLDSPQYGERWGRHWLDVAGYTDAPHTDIAGEFLPIDDWRYRDYVVRSYNDDKPYDGFLTEQLAGDELVDWRAAAKFTPQIVDPLIATGYLRTTPDWTHGDQMQEIHRYDTLSRVVDHVATGLLGLTMGCVRCHSHKFDPIPHQDYYRLMAVFATAYNPTDWKRPIDRYLADVSPSDQEEIARQNAKIDALVADQEQRLEEVRRPHRQRLFANKLLSVPMLLREDVKAAIETPADKQDDVQRYLAKKFADSLKVSSEEVNNTLGDSEKVLAASLGQQIAVLKASKPRFGRIQALWDVGQPPTIHELMRGNSETPGPEVKPGFVSVLCEAGKSVAVRPAETAGNSSGRRLAFAQWLTNRDHPLTARVMVNRVWMHHFGKGIVETPENFGHSGAPPTHPELLDWLAVDFMEHGWHVKRLHKLIMTSTAYRQSSHRPAESGPQGVDAGNELLWRMNLRRMEAEVLRDAVLSVSGKLDATMGGPPIPLDANPDGLVTVPEKGPAPNSQWRRSMYLRALRGSHPSGKGFSLSMLEVFDFPEIVINCTRRVNSTTPLQSLALVNSKFMMEQARYFALRVRESAGAQSPAAKQVEVAFLLAFGREPSAGETTFCLEHLRAQTGLYLSLNLSADEAAQRALSSLCLMLFASNEFLYIG